MALGSGVHSRCGEHFLGGRNRLADKAEASAAHENQPKKRQLERTGLDHLDGGVIALLLMGLRAVRCALHACCEFGRRQLHDECDGEHDNAEDDA